MYICGRVEASRGASKNSPFFFDDYDDDAQVYNMLRRSRGMIVANKRYTGERDIGRFWEVCNWINL